MSTDYRLQLRGGQPSLTTASGTFALTGFATGLSRSRNLAAASGSFALTGNAISQQRYETAFASNESEISEGGKWHGGLRDGLDWTAIITSGGLAVGSQSGGASSGPPYNDSIACCALGFPPNQEAELTLDINTSGDAGFYHEAEILLRFDISNNDAHGYECLYAWDGSYCEIVKWLGPLNSFASLVSGTPNGALATSDVLRARAVGSTISLYRNNSLVAQVTDATWTSGNPGMGFWRRGGSGAHKIRGSLYKAKAL